MKLDTNDFIFNQFVSLNLWKFTVWFLVYFNPYNFDINCLHLIRIIKGLKSSFKFLNRIKMRRNFFILRHLKKKILINYFYLDEETSYILYWKYVLLCKSICQQADYKSDIKYYEGNCFISKQVDYKESK